VPTVANSISPVPRVCDTLLRCVIFSGRESEKGPGCVKTQSDLVVMPSGG
jgi:hypothetical protein